MFKKIGLMAKQHTQNIADALSFIINYLSTLKAEVIVEQETLNVIPNCNLQGVARQDLGKHCDLLIVIGGDGSLLSASRVAAKQNLPVVGVNLGTLGFLTDILPDKINLVGEILKGKFREEQRFMLEGTVYPNHKKQTSICNDIALNDIVLLAGEAGHMVEFSLYLDNILVSSYRSDGLIISTPTGSTAHALAGGGPIVHPSLNALAIVPMFSHNLSSRSIVINADSALKIVTSHCEPEYLKIVFDGQNETAIPKDGEIIIKKANEKLRLIHPLDYDYFESLRVKLGWER